MTIALPVGVSFYTFQAISYVVDVKRRPVKPASLIDAAVYLSFFPHLVAGPDRARPRVPAPARKTAQPQSRRGRFGPRADRARARQEGRDRRLPRPRDRGTRVRRSRRPTRAPTCCSPPTATRPRSTATSPATPTSRSGSRCCSATCSRRTSEAPTAPPGFRDFWRRWHMTLSRFLRDFLYIPLGGNRGGRAGHLPQPDDHDGPRRAVARRRLDVRAVGRLPGRRASSPSTRSAGASGRPCG